MKLIRFSYNAVLLSSLVPSNISESSLSASKHIGVGVTGPCFWQSRAHGGDSAKQSSSDTAQQRSVKTDTCQCTKSRLLKFHNDLARNDPIPL